MQDQYIEVDNGCGGIDIVKYKKLREWKVMGYRISGRDEYLEASGLLYLEGGDLEKTM